MSTPSDTGNTNLDFLSELELLLQSRKQEMPEGSYTTSLYQKGIDKIAQKVGEEAVELVIASKNSDEEETIYEAADLVYHLLVLLTEKEIPFDRVLSELKRRSR